MRIITPCAFVAVSILAGCADDPRVGEAGTAVFDVVDSDGLATGPLVAEPIVAGDELRVRVTYVQSGDAVLSVQSSDPDVLEVVYDRQEYRFIETSARPLICFSSCMPSGYSEATGAHLVTLRAVQPGEAELVAELRDGAPDRVLVVVQAE